MAALDLVVSDDLTQPTEALDYQTGEPIEIQPI
jgi:hypothetical protein